MAVPYELDFALRTCEQHSTYFVVSTSQGLIRYPTTLLRSSFRSELDKSTVFLYCVSEMFSDAVDLSFKVLIFLKFSLLLASVLALSFLLTSMSFEQAFGEDGVTIAKECAHMMDPDEEDVIMGLEPKFSVEYRRRIWLKIGLSTVGSFNAVLPAKDVFTRALGFTLNAMPVNYIRNEFLDLIVYS